MDNEYKIYIDEDRQFDKTSIYFVLYSGNRKIYYHIENGMLVETVHEMNFGEFKPMKPLIELPSRIARIFLSVLNDEIENKGINTRKVDMQAGKAELLQERLKFSDDQLVKFIDYFTTKPILNVKAEDSIQ